jgi:hypothetical protein
MQRELLPAVIILACLVSCAANAGGLDTPTGDVWISPGDRLDTRVLVEPVQSGVLVEPSSDVWPVPQERTETANRRPHCTDRAYEAVNFCS